MTPVNGYRDRADAGQALAKLLRNHAINDNSLVLALPRGGVPVGAQIAPALGAPLDIFVVRKIGHPENPEVAIGAIASGDIRLLDDSLIAENRLSRQTVADIVEREKSELKRRESLYRGDHPALEVTGRHVILVDDGIATGYSIRVAIIALQQLRPATVTIAAPVGAPDTCAFLSRTVDEFVCPLQPTPFHAVGLWYDHFPPVTDQEVRNLLAPP